MPKVVQTDREMADRQTRAVIESAREMQGIDNPKLIKALNISASEYYRRRRDTDCFRLGDIRRIVRVLHISDEGIVKIVRGH